MGLIKKSAAGGSLIKSIQHFTPATIKTSPFQITMNPVDMNQAIVMIDYQGIASTIDKAFPRAEIINNTTIQLTTVSSSNWLNVRITVIEYDPKVLVQKFTVSMLGNATANVDIGSVDLSKTFHVWSWEQSSAANQPEDLLIKTYLQGTKLYFERYRSTSNGIKITAYVVTYP